MFAKVFVMFAAAIAAVNAGAYVAPAYVAGAPAAYVAGASAAYVASLPYVAPVASAAYVAPYASSYSAHSINHAVAAPYVAAPVLL